MQRKGQRIAGGVTPARRPECDRAVSPAQAGRFALALRDGATVLGAAASAGVAVATLYYRRKVDADFAALWADAVAGASENTAAERAGERAAKDAAQGMAVRDHPDRGVVRKRRRAVEFTRTRRQIFLDHLAGGCNMAAAAAAAGVTDRTVRKALAEDGAFAAGFDAALAVGYRAIEADTLSQQQEAREAYRLSPTDDPEAGQRTFEQSMRLLHEYRRRDGSIGRRPRGIRPRVATYEEVRVAVAKALAAFEKRVRAMGYKIPDGGPGALPGPEAPGAEAG
jgi:hypothetical protein